MPVPHVTVVDVDFGTSLSESSPLNCGDFISGMMWLPGSSVYRIEWYASRTESGQYYPLCSSGGAPIVQYLVGGRFHAVPGEVLTARHVKIVGSTAGVATFVLKG